MAQLLLYFIYTNAPPIVAEHPELMKQALQLKPKYKKVQLNKRLHHIVQHLNLEMSICRVHETYQIQII